MKSGVYGFLESLLLERNSEYCSKLTLNSASKMEFSGGTSLSGEILCRSVVPPRKSLFSSEVHKEGSLKVNFHSQIFLVSGKLFVQGKCEVKIFFPLRSFELMLVWVKRPAGKTDTLITLDFDVRDYPDKAFASANGKS